MFNFKYFVFFIIVFSIAACTEPNTENTSSTTTKSPAAMPAPAPMQEQAQPEMADPSVKVNKDEQAPKMESAPETSSQTTDEKATAELSLAIMNLAKNSGCLACHKIDKKLVGPAWQDVAKRYSGDKDAKQILITKVSKGGKGNWTEVTGGVAMPPYAPRVTPENIDKLVTFILSLNTE